jgi:hypothetical protein
MEVAHLLFLGKAAKPRLRDVLLKTARIAPLPGKSSRKRGFGSPPLE